MVFAGGGVGGLEQGLVPSELKTNKNRSWSEWLGIRCVCARCIKEKINAEEGSFIRSTEDNKLAFSFPSLREVWKYPTS